MGMRVVLMAPSLGTSAQIPEGSYWGGSGGGVSPPFFFSCLVLLSLVSSSPFFFSLGYNC